MFAFCKKFPLFVDQATVCVYRDYGVAADGEGTTPSAASANGTTQR